MRTVTTTQADALAEETLESILKNLLELSHKWAAEHKLPKEEWITLPGNNPEETKRLFKETFMKLLSDLIVITPE